MNKLENLIVRVCKNKSYSRLCSIRRRFYITNGVDDKHILDLLVDVCEKYGISNNRTNMDLLCMLNPEHWDHWKYNKELSFTRNCIEFYISLLRISKFSLFDGYVSPLRFKNNSL